MNPRLRKILEEGRWLGVLALLTLGQGAFWQASSDPFAPVERVLLRVLVPLCLLPLLAAAPGLRSRFSSWGARWLAAWVLWLLVSAATGPYPGEGLKTAVEYGLEASAFFLAGTARGGRRLELVAAFFCASLLSALYGLCQHFGADPLAWSTDFSGRPLGTIGNPDFFGGHLVLAFGLGLGLLVAAPRAGRGLAALSLALLALVLFYARSVGPWLGMAACLGVAAAFLLSADGASLRGRLGLGRKALARGLGLGLVLAGLAAASPPGQRAWTELRGEKRVSVVNRAMMWRAALDLWRTRPVQGAGLGSFRPEFPRLQAGILAAEKDRGWNYVVTWLPHENFLYLLCESGLIGCLLFVLAWGASAWACWRRAARGDGLAFAALLATSGMAGVSLLNTFSNIPPTALGFFLLLGFSQGPAGEEDRAVAGAEGLAQGAGGPRDPRGPGPGGLRSAAPLLEGWVLAASLAACLALGLPAGRELAANRLTREASRATGLGDPAAGAVLYAKASGMGISGFTQQSVVGVDFDLAECQRKLGRLDLAADSYRRDLVRNPWAPETHNMLGAALGQLGQARGDRALVEEGAGHLRTALWLSPGYAAALINLGGSCAILGDVSGAAGAWGEVLKLDPENRQARAYLGELNTKR